MECDRCSSKCELEDISGERIWVCTSCGAVMDCVKDLVHDSRDLLAAARLPPELPSSTSQSAVYRSCLKKLKSGIAALSAGEEVLKDAIQFFSGAYEKHGRRHKAALMSAAVYAAILSNDTEVPLKLVSQVFGVKMKKVKMTHSNLCFSHGSHQHLNMHRLMTVYVRLLLEEDANRSLALDLAGRLYHFLDRFLLISSLLPNSTAAAVVRIAVTSATRNYAIDDTRLDEELRRSHVKSIKPRLRFFSDFLVQVGRSVPWLENITRKSVHMYLDDILKYGEGFCDGIQLSSRNTVHRMQSSRYHRRTTVPHSTSSVPSSLEDVTDDVIDADVEQYIRTPEEVQQASVLWDAAHPVCSNSRRPYKRGVSGCELD